VAAKIDQAASDLLVAAEFDEAGAECLASPRANRGEVAADSPVHDHVALGRPSVLRLSNPVFLQLRAPPFAILGHFAGVVCSVEVANSKIGAGCLPLAAADFDSR